MIGASMIKPIIADKIYISADQVSLKDVKAAYEKILYDEKQCSRCDNKPERFNHICAACPAFLMKLTLWNKVEIEGDEYYSVPSGDPKSVQKNLKIKLRKVRDLRCKVPFKYKIRFTGKLRNGEIVDGTESVRQQDIVDKFLKYTGGQLESRTRSGKTVMGTYIICEYGMRTLILVKSDDLARQFMKGIRKVTNIDQLEAKLGRKIAVIAKKDQDFVGPDIVIANYQKFIHPKTGRSRLKRLLLRKFGTVLVDEIHNASARAFSTVINSLDCYHKMGLSATTTRKDGLHIVVGIPIMGPVRAVGEGTGLVPRIEIIHTKLKPKSEPKLYTTAMAWLSNNDERNKMLVRKVFEILRSDPKRCILIPVMRVDHCEKLCALINRQARVNNEKRGEVWNTSRLALPYHGKTPREQNLAYAAKGKGTRVMVGMRQMVGEFLDIPSWTDVLHSFLFSNEEKTIQLIARPCTPAPDKPQPVIHTFVDDLGLTRGCFRTTFISNYVKHKLVMSPETRKLGYSLLNSGSSWGARAHDVDPIMDNDISNIPLW
jgi:hypothetical protein